MSCKVDSHVGTSELRILQLQEECQSREVLVGELNIEKAKKKSFTVN